MPDLIPTDGMREEAQRLVNRAGMPAQVGKVAPGFNKAWVPGKL